MNKKYLLTLCVLCSFAWVAGAQTLKFNFPILGGMLNAGTEISLGRHFTLNADVMYSPYMFNDGKVLKFINTSLEARYYVKKNPYHFYKAFEGFYLGPYGQFAWYNVGLTDYRYKGWLFASGLSLGYQLYLSSHLRLDFNLGVGYAQLQYDKYQLGPCNEVPMEKDFQNWWIGPTKFGISLAYYFL